MEQRPVLEKPRPLLSAIIVNIISFIIFLASILCFIGAIGENSLLGISRTIIGLSGVAISALFTIIATIAEDVHYQRYVNAYYVEEVEWYHTLSLQKLHSIEALLIQQTYPQQPPFVSAPYTPVPQYEQQQQSPQPEMQMQEVSSQGNDYHSESNTDLKEHEPVDASPSEYKAQYRRPIPRKKNNSNSQFDETIEE